MPKSKPSTIPVRKAQGPARFVSSAAYYEANRRDGQTLQIVAADMGRPDGKTEPAVAFLIAGMPRLIIRTDDALRAAHGIADTLSQINQQKEN